MGAGFVHLRLHTEYSLVDSIVRIDALMETTTARGMHTVAITDFCNLFAAVKVFKAALAKGIKPILGVHFLCVGHPDFKTPVSLVALCQNQQGYRNLTCLVSKAYQQGQHQGQPQVHIDWLTQHADGLILLSGGIQGPVGCLLQHQDREAATRVIKLFKECFPGRFYLEIQRIGLPGEHHHNAQLVELADAFQLPLVATNDVRFIDKADFEAHEARVCINRGQTLSDTNRSTIYTEQQYLRTAEEMCTLFSDLPQSIANTIKISERCNVILDLGHNYLPNFPIPTAQSPADYLATLALNGLNERLDRLLSEKKDLTTDLYYERLKTELSVINNMGFSGYFLIVADFIQWAKQQGIPVGPGRGSGAGSLVAYVLGITDLDPLHYELLFERFLNPERVSMPDFDIDFCMEGRDKVIDYVAEKYGRHCVSQIITFGTMAAKAVVRDVGRVLGYPYGFVDKLAKLIPFELGITLTKALAQEALLAKRYEEEDDVRILFDLALKLEGLVRNASKHAGGVVIAPSQLTDFTAIYCEQGSSQIVSQFDKDDVEAVGLVKFDFLGLRTLTIIDWALDIINKDLKEGRVDITRIPTNDPLTFSLLKKGQTTAVFQLESRGMKDLINRLQPDCFEDIIALVALFRPGPLQSGMVDDFIDRKHGRSQVIYAHDRLEPILKPTYGVILYQEQVMQIAQFLAGYTLGSADMLRRAMGKKKPEEMQQQRSIFVKGAKNNGIAEEVAVYIFDLMEKFAGYGFNKSHSAAYALVAYQTAWLKAHYPSAFMAAVMSSEKDNTDKLFIFFKECKDMALTVLEPSINLSQELFTAVDVNTIRYGLAAIKGVGGAAIQVLITERNARGSFTGLFNLCSRLDLRKVNKRVLEALIKSGAMDEWQIERAILMASLEHTIKRAEVFQKNKGIGQIDLFSTLDPQIQPDEMYIQVPPWCVKNRLAYEKETLGFYLTGHPASAFTEEFKHKVLPLNALIPVKNKAVCGLIASMRRVLTKRGDPLHILTIEDASGTVDVIVFKEVFESQGIVFEVGDFLLIEGDLAVDSFNGGVRMTASKLYTLLSARLRFTKALMIHIKPEDGQALAALKTILSESPGSFPVQVTYNNGEAEAVMNLDKEYWVSPTDELLTALRELLGQEDIHILS